MPAAPGLQKLRHNYVTNTALPYISNASPIETRPHFKSGSNVLTSLRGYASRRPGFRTYTTDIFTNPIKRIFAWRLWNGAYFVMVNEVGGGQSKVYKLKIATDTTFQLIFTSSTASVFDFVTGNNVVYFGNGTDMKKYDGTTVTNWGIAKPAAAPSATAASGSINAANNGYSWRYAFGNSATGHIGAISAATAYTGNFTGRNYVITGSTTTDTQVNEVHVYRTADGGSVWYELPNSPVAYSGSWSITDSAADGSLNTANRASLLSMNLPPTASQGCCFYAGRIWTFAGDKVYYSNFEEEINGIDDESFYSINVYAFGQQVTGLVPTQRALLITTASAVFRITGDSLTTFNRQPFLTRMGTQQQANVVSGGGRAVAWLDSTGTVYFTDGIGTQEPGLPIRADFATVAQTSASCGFHSNGVQQWFIVQDSSQSLMWVYDMDNSIWMVPWSIGGTAIFSAETSAGVYTLLIASTTNKVLQLDTTIYQDQGSSYTANAVTGLMDLCAGQGPGEVGDMEYVALETNSVVATTVSYLTDEDPTTGSFTAIASANIVSAPNRTQGSNLLENWYYSRVTTARRAAVKINWAAASTEFRLYSIDMVGNQLEGA